MITAMAIFRDQRQEGYAASNTSSHTPNDRVSVKRRQPHVANEARNRRKAANRRLHLALRAAADRPSGAAAPSPEAAALAGEQRAALLAALNALREDDRRVIAYRYFLDLSEGEMADALGCARGTVKSRLSRALGRLRPLLTGHGGDPPPAAGVAGGAHG